MKNPIIGVDYGYFISDIIGCTSQPSDKTYARDVRDALGPENATKIGAACADRTCGSGQFDL